MKSKRAEEYIDENIYDAAECVDKDGCGWAVVKRSDAYRAVEFAETEMVEKAGRVFCAAHCPKGCPLENSDGCGAIREFKQKMDEV